LQGLASSKSEEETSNLETQGKADVADRVQRLSADRMPSFLGKSVFYVRSSTDWVRDIHIMEGYLL